MKLKLKNLYIMLFLLFIIFISSYFNVLNFNTNELFKVEGYDNQSEPSGISDSSIDKSLGYTFNREINNNDPTNTSSESTTTTTSTSTSTTVDLSNNLSYDPNRFNINTNNLANGIYINQIPDGDEDLYILKSQVVPPVCPACPTVNACPRQEPPPPCPPCARCPEPSFECQKVPNYSSNNVSRYVPRPVLADFSQFGM